jgi:Cu(I)/Ag(I) efflux system membrane protein CusA/SilA
MKRLIIVTLSFAALSFAAVAQDLVSDDAVSQSRDLNLPKVRGWVRRVDVARSHVTLKHDEIPNLSMPAMTMDFAVPDVEMIKNLRPGQKVLLMADTVNNELTAVWIEKQD